MDNITIIIVAPSLNTYTNVSGVSAVTNFIISNNSQQKYQHFLQGKTDEEKRREDLSCMKSHQKLLSMEENLQIRTR